MVRSKEKKERASGDAHRSVVETDAAPIITATLDYERWLKKRVDVVDADLQRKHEEMASFALRVSQSDLLSVGFALVAGLPWTSPRPPRCWRWVISTLRTSELGVMPRVGLSGASMM